MRLLLLVALVLFIFALIVANGGTILTSWPVWLCGGFIAWVLDQLVGDRAVYRRGPAPPA